DLRRAGRPRLRRAEPHAGRRRAARGAERPPPGAAAHRAVPHRGLPAARAAAGAPGPRRRHRPRTPRGCPARVRGRAHARRLGQSRRPAARHPAARRLARAGRRARALPLDRARPHARQRAGGARAARWRPEPRDPLHAGQRRMDRPLAAGEHGGPPRLAAAPAGGRVRARNRAGGPHHAARGGGTVTVPGRHRRDRGVALVTAMLISALAALVASDMAWDNALEVRRTTVLLQRDQAVQVALGAESWARLILSQDANDTPTDHLGEIWAQELPPLPIDGGGEVFGSLEDLEGRFNINNLI